MRTTETATQALHRLTSYPSDPDWDEPLDLSADARLLQDFVPLDLERLPWQYKRYEEDLQRRELPAELARAGESSALDLAQLARLLYFSSGVVRFSEWAPAPGGRFLFRASGSAGGRYPLELYAAVPEGMGLPAGVHWYDPEGHALVEVGPPPRGDSVAIVVTGIPWRTGWKYRERGFRHIYWDAGAMLAQLLALAAYAGIEHGLVTRFPDETVDAVVGAHSVDEFSLAVVAVGSTSAAIEPGGPAHAGSVDRDPVEFPLVTEAQRAGRMNTWGEPWRTGDLMAHELLARVYAAFLDS